MLSETDRGTEFKQASVTQLMHHNDLSFQMYIDGVHAILYSAVLIYIIIYRKEMWSKSNIPDSLNSFFMKSYTLTNKLTLCVNFTNKYKRTASKILHVI